ncbi:MAG: tRNA uridine(34) 5-carboxymethylaminomethyl modification radical SAM/GNAT enzyme Elp3, partial [Halobacteriota archaeon]
MNEAAEAEGDAFERVVEELARRVVEGEITRDEVESAKHEVCAEHSSPRVPRNSDVLEAVDERHREDAAEVLRTTPVRTASGVT